MLSSKTFFSKLNCEKLVSAALVFTQLSHLCVIEDLKHQRTHWDTTGLEHSHHQLCVTKYSLLPSAAVDRAFSLHLSTHTHTYSYMCTSSFFVFFPLCFVCPSIFTPAMPRSGSSRPQSIPSLDIRISTDHAFNPKKKKLKKTVCSGAE